MRRRQTLTRREAVALSFAATTLPLVGTQAAVTGDLHRTPTQVLGPFYPVLKPLDQDADMTVVKGRSGRASGQILYMMGRVINRHRQPLAGIRMEVWQANARGRYLHVSDRNPEPVDPNFEGYAVITSDSEGRYRFKTIKPGAYPQDSGQIRAPHIHFDVAGRKNRLVSQMYFPDEPLNKTDAFLQIVGPNIPQLVVTLRPPQSDMEAGALFGEWDIVLDEG